MSKMFQHGNQKLKCINMVRMKIGVFIGYQILSTCCCVSIWKPKVNLMLRITEKSINSVCAKEVSSLETEN